MNVKYRSSAFSTALCIASLLYAGTAFAKDSIYKWQDEKGVTHYSQSPPENKATAVEQVKTSTKASSNQEQELEQLQQYRQKEAKRLKDAASQSATPEKKSEKSQDEARAERCKQNKANLNTLRNQPIVRLEDPETGEMVILDADQRQKMVDDATSALKECD